MFVLKPNWMQPKQPEKETPEGDRGVNIGRSASRCATQYMFFFVFFKALVMFKWGFLMLWTFLQHCIEMRETPCFTSLGSTVLVTQCSCFLSIKLLKMTYPLLWYYRAAWFSCDLNKRFLVRRVSFAGFMPMVCLELYRGGMKRI